MVFSITALSAVAGDRATAVTGLRSVGFALHWLYPRAKNPRAGKGWSEAPVATLEELRASYQPDNNLGVRLGQPSLLLDGSYLHVIDIDIRVADQAAEAWARLSELLPGHASLPCVISGSGGESRHLYFTTAKPLFGRKLAVSDGKHRDAAGTWHYDWEIELFGTGKQVAMPPSIHPDTGLPYVWERPFDLEAFAVGDGPSIAPESIEAIGAIETSTYAYESRPPLTFEPGQLERDLDTLPIERIDDYADWIMLGQALHHQFGASTEGFDLWVKHSKRSTKFDGKDLLRKWRGFGRNRRQPVTMGTIRAWAQDARHAALVDQFDEGDADTADASGEDSETDEFEALLASSTPPATATSADSSDDAPALNWKSLLHLSEENEIKATLHNARLIVENDPRTVGVAAYNEFQNHLVQRAKPGKKPPARAKAAKPTVQLTGSTWELKDPVNGDIWTDDKDTSVRAMIEAPKPQGGYSIKMSDRDLRGAIDIAGRRNAFHPVREYLSKLKWDGVPRCETLFMDYLGAPDNAYIRNVARLFLIATVCRVHEPGHKFDFAVILEGIQGKRKSTFIGVLARNEKWFAELDGDFEDQKQMTEVMQGKWILEIPELGGFVKSDVRHIKAFISRQVDRCRLAYDRRAQDYHRQCTFVGSTNDDKYLKDDTGGRRFWPIECVVDEIDVERLEANMDQVWAEALVLYRAMRAARPKGTLPLYLQDDEAKGIADDLQENARQENAGDALAGQIGAWLDTPINSGNFDDDLDAAGQPLYRNEVCLLEIWVDCLGRDRGSYNHAMAQMLGGAIGKVGGWKHGGGLFSHPIYGRQRPYRRGGWAGHQRRLIATFKTT